MGGDQKLLDKMRASRFGWGADDIHRLLSSYDFQWREGGKHRVYWHPKLKEKPVMVGRHKPLGPGYVRDAIAAAQDLLEIEKRERGD